jgi:hypothetical protein
MKCYAAYAALCRSGTELSSASQLPYSAIDPYKCDKVFYTMLREGGHSYNTMNIMVAMAALSSSNSHLGFADVSWLDGCHGSDTSGVPTHDSISLVCLLSQILSDYYLIPDWHKYFAYMIAHHVAHWFVDLPKAGLLSLSPVFHMPPDSIKQSALCRCYRWAMWVHWDSCRTHWRYRTVPMIELKSFCYRTHFGVLLFGVSECHWSYSHNCIALSAQDFATHTDGKSPAINGPM